MSFTIEKQGLEKMIRLGPPALQTLPTSEEPQTTHSNWAISHKKGGILTGKTTLSPNSVVNTWHKKRDMQAIKISQAPRIWSNTREFKLLQPSLALWPSTYLFAAQSACQENGGVVGRRRPCPVTAGTYTEKRRSRGEAGGAGGCCGPRLRLGSRGNRSQSSRNTTACWEGGRSRFCKLISLFC